MRNILYISDQCAIMQIYTCIFIWHNRAQVQEIILGDLGKHLTFAPLRGLVKFKKIKINPRKTRKWVGQVFLFCFFLFIFTCLIISINAKRDESDK